MFMLCDTIQSEQLTDGKIIQNLKNPVCVLRPNFIPSNFSFGLSFSIQDIDIHKENHLHVTINDPLGKLMYDSGDTIIKSDDKDTLPVELQGFVLCADFRNLIFNVEGIHIITIALNEEKIYEHDLPVYIK